MIAALYRQRWQVELFFKRIKQYLHIKVFYGASENAVKTQIWIAVCTYMLIAIAKKCLQLQHSLYEILQILSLTMFEIFPTNQLLTKTSKNLTRILSLNTSHCSGKRRDATVRISLTVTVKSHVQMINWLATLLMAWLLPHADVFAAGYQAPKDALVWTMVNVNHTPQQGDAHLLQFSSGEVVLIDAAYYQPAKDVLIPFLKERNIKKIDYFFASHPHKDHYQGIKAVLESGITVSQAYFNIPNKAVCDSEIPWGCDYAEILAYHEMLEKSGTKINLGVAGSSIKLKNNSKILILYAFDGVKTPVGSTDVNDLSLIMRVDQGSTRILFTGDLNNRIGGWLAKNGKGIKASILKFPHHGTENAAPDSFYSAVAPKIALIPSPALLWCSGRSERMKKWVEKRKIPAYVNGFVGHVTVRVNGGRVKVQRQNPAGVKCDA